MSAFFMTAFRSDDIFFVDALTETDKCLRRLDQYTRKKILVKPHRITDFVDATLLLLLSTTFQICFTDHRMYVIGVATSRLFRGHQISGIGLISSSFLVETQTESYTPSEKIFLASCPLFVCPSSAQKYLDISLDDTTPSPPFPESVPNDVRGLSDSANILRDVQHVRGLSFFICITCSHPSSQHALALRRKITHNWSCYPYIFT